MSNDKRQENAEERRQRELEEFNYVVSHDLQEPLRKIQGFTSLLEKRYREQLDDQGREYIQYLREACDRMQQLIKDLLRVSRVDSRGQPPAPVATTPLVRELVADLEPRLEAAGAQVEITGELPTVDADGKQLRQVFEQLILNAIKFRRSEEPRIHIAAEAAATGGWHFRVADNGIGIDEGFTDKIFGVFQRLHTRDEYPGTGVGLALCKRIIERHGGEIWVESMPEQGSTFHFRLPDGGGRIEQTEDTRV